MKRVIISFFLCLSVSFFTGCSSEASLGSRHSSVLPLSKKSYDNLSENDVGSTPGTENATTAGQIAHTEPEIYCYPSNTDSSEPDIKNDSDTEQLSNNEIKACSDTEPPTMPVEPENLSDIPAINFDIGIDYESIGFDIEKHEFKQVEGESRTSYVIINYPQIINYTDGVREAKINRLLWMGALRGEEDFVRREEAALTNYCKVVYDITYASEDTISVLFRGYGFSSLHAASTFFAYGVTVNLTEVRIITLDEVVLINDAVRKKVSSGDYAAYCDQMWDQLYFDKDSHFFDYAIDDGDALPKNSMSSLFSGLQDVYDYFIRSFDKNYDLSNMRNFYIKSNAVGFIVNTFTAIGDYVILEVTTAV